MGNLLSLIGFYLIVWGVIGLTGSHITLIGAAVLGAAFGVHGELRRKGIL